MIQWFPGHMTKALRQIEEKATLADLFIVVLDARAPLSSYNNEFERIAPHKPRLFVITKSDLADAAKLTRIVGRFTSDGNKAIVANLHRSTSRTKILHAINELLTTKRQAEAKKGIINPRLRAIVVGVPNSGKSTLINLLANAAKTKVANRPGVTRGQQWVTAGEILLLDTPGILWPKFTDELVGIRLAIIGSIRTDVIPLTEIFYASYKLLSTYYPERLTALGLPPSQSEKTIYSALGDLCQNKHFIASGGKIDFDKGMKWFTVYVRDMQGVTYD